MTPCCPHCHQRLRGKIAKHHGTVILMLEAGASYHSIAYAIGATPPSLCAYLDLHGLRRKPKTTMKRSSFITKLYRAGIRGAEHQAQLAEFDAVQP